VVDVEVLYAKGNNGTGGGDNKSTLEHEDEMMEAEVEEDAEATLMEEAPLTVRVLG
jgi:hypothetical protein